MIPETANMPFHNLLSLESGGEGEEVDGDSAMAEKHRMEGNGVGFE